MSLKAPAIANLLIQASFNIIKSKITYVGKRKKINSGHRGKRSDAGRPKGTTEKYKKVVKKKLHFVYLLRKKKLSGIY